MQLFTLHIYSISRSLFFLSLQFHFRENALFFIEKSHCKSSGLSRFQKLSFLFFFLTSSDTIAGSNKGCHHHESQVECDVGIIAGLRRCLCSRGARRRIRCRRSSRCGGRCGSRLGNRLRIRLFLLGVRYCSLHSSAVS